MAFSSTPECAHQDLGKQLGVQPGAFLGEQPADTAVLDPRPLRISQRLTQTNNQLLRTKVT
ncbi:hypothetical protein [Streptomyces sp. NPDC048637]|uniref:hypothetical protein n=1 Tax=Streptomyces sp. NPDC048637 TaxID=3155636 RepID=UPI003445B649